MTPEQKARVSIDALLVAAGWHVCNVADANIHAATGVAIREFPLNSGFGFADYLLYVNGKACGVIEAKKEGATLTGVEMQSSRYAQGLPTTLPAWRRPLPFVWESTGIETHFTNGLDPEPRARAVFAYFRPELLVQWLAYLQAAAASNTAQEAAGTFLTRMCSMPELVTEWGSGGAHYSLWPAQISAITNLEKSLAANKPKALIQMATGSGKTFTSIGFIYRLIKFGGARRVLFLVDRGNLARQTKKEFDAYASPYNNYKFGEEYIVQHLQGNQLDTSARVVICTIQRMFSMLKGRELAEEADEESTEKIETLFKDAEPIGYNPAIPIESFDIVVTDEAHRSIYNLWRQVLEYFDAYLIGLTATPNKQTFGFFNQYLVMEYGHAQAVADAVGLRRVPSAYLEEQLIPLPDIGRQREIVAELEKQFSRLDEAVANLLRVKANLKRYKASVLKAAVEGRLVETESAQARREGRTYETGEQLLQRIVGSEEIRTNTSKSSKSSEQGDCPEGWARTSIGRISEFSFYGPRFSSDAYSDKGVLFCARRISMNQAESTPVRPRELISLPRTCRSTVLLPVTCL